MNKCERCGKEYEPRVRGKHGKYCGELSNIWSCKAKANRARRGERYQREKKHDGGGPGPETKD